MITTQRMLLGVWLLGVAACGADPRHVPFALQADRFDNAAWSEPVNLGPLINSSALDGNAGVSPDGLSLYFVSARPGGLGGNDIWVSHRSCVPCDWETPANLGAPINSDAGEGAPTLSDDGRMLFFFSLRSGGFGSADIYVSTRVSTGADGDTWGDPVNLGPDVNTAGTENGAYYVREGGEPDAVLYFNRSPTNVNVEMYRVSLTNEGEPVGPAVIVPELNSPVADQKIAMRADGHELLLSTNRDGGFGNFDIWSFTRQGIHDPWSGPVHLDAPLNTPDIESQPSLSRDGGTLIFTSNRAGGYGAQDLWMSTRRPSPQ
ncbi:MAG: hypothetical protein E6J91_33900 [Deltaproteobacteria bacterium]|nr:MAG: hypothetical protein E6J91_33900 [Deltaproteobacteria bacterium]